MTVIVSCGYTRQSLSAVRSLGRAHIPVAVGSPKRPSLAMWSRFATSTFLTIDPATNPKDFAEQVADELLGRYATCALFSSDEAFWALSRFRELLPACARRILPPHISVIRSLDHEALYHFASSLNIPCVRLLRIAPNQSLNEISLSVKALNFPVLLRPIIPSIEREDNLRPFIYRMVANSAAHLRQLLEQNKHLLEVGFLLSDYKSLRSLSYFGVADKGQILAEGFQERLNEEQPYSEVSTLASTILPIPAIKKYSRSLLMALNWQGPFKVEFVKDKHNFKLVSLIGRMWGSMELAIKAGVNIPLITYHLAEGIVNKDIIKTAKPNIMLRWVIGDALAKAARTHRIFSDILRLKMPRFNFGLFKNRLKSNKTSIYYDVMNLEDPMPFLFELQHTTWKKAVEETSHFFAK